MRNPREADAAQAGVVLRRRSVRLSALIDLATLAYLAALLASFTLPVAADESILLQPAAANSQFDPYAAPETRQVRATAPTTSAWSSDTILATDGYGRPAGLPYPTYPHSAYESGGSDSYLGILPADNPNDCFCTPAPCYFGTFYASGVVLDRRTDLRPTGLIFDPTFTTEVANTADFNFDTEAGFRFGLWLTSPCGVDFNVEYFNVSNFDDTVARSDAATLNAPFFGSSFAVAPTTITGEYVSDLNSLEFQFRIRQSRRLAPLVGIRLLRIDEDFNLLDDTANRTGFFSTTDNKLFGFQFGLQALIYEWHRSRLEAIVKGGVYGNDIDVTAYDSTGAFATTTSGTNWTTFGGDAKVSYIYRLGPRCNFRVSYQALWMDGVALAVNQNTARNFQPAIGPIDLTDVLYQGGEIGFEISW